MKTNSEKSEQHKKSKEQSTPASLSSTQSLEGISEHLSEKITPTRSSQKKVVKPRSKKVSSSHTQKKNSLSTMFVEITPDHYFVLCDGVQIKDPRAFADLLATLSDDVFYYHVTDSRNDFATWIRDVFRDEELARMVEPIHNRLLLRSELYKYWLERLE